MKDFCDLHTHTLASGHAYNTLYEMVKEAKEKKIAVFGITEHAPAMPGSCQEIYFSNLRVVPRDLFEVQLRLGSELNIVDYRGKVDLGESMLRQLDYCIASIHLPCLTPGSAKENTMAYAGAMENPHVVAIGHPDDGRVPVDFDILAKEAREHGVALELNQASLKPGGFRKNTWENAEKMLLACEKYGALVLMSSDAHIGTEVGNHSLPLKLLEQVGFPQELVVNASMERVEGLLKSRGLKG